MVWKNTSTMFSGGTNEARALKGRRVRTIRAMKSATVHLTDPTRQVGPLVNIPARAEGFVGYVPEYGLHLITIAFPKSGTGGTSLEDLMRRSADVFHVDWQTFRSNFEIDI
jgi:hypothetical protein